MVSVTLALVFSCMLLFFFAISTSSSGIFSSTTFRSFCVFGIVAGASFIFVFFDEILAVCFFVVVAVVDPLFRAVGICDAGVIAPGVIAPGFLTFSGALF